MTCSFIGKSMLFKGFFRNFVDRVGESSYDRSISGKKWKEVVNFVFEWV